MRPIILFASSMFLLWQGCATEAINESPASLFVKEKIALIEGAYPDGYFSGTFAMDAIITLERVTGIQSQLMWADNAEYSSEAVMKEDVKRWEDWYETNKGHISYDKMKLVEIDVMLIGRCK